VARIFGILVVILLAFPALAQVTQLTPTPVQTFFYNGVPLAGGCLFTYAAGSTTKLNTFVDGSGATPNTDPIVLSSQGTANIWLSPGLSYKFVLAPATSPCTDPPTAPIWTVDNVSAFGPGGLYPSRFEAPVGPTYDASAADNGAIIVSSAAAGALNVVLPPTTTIANGWSLGIEPSTSHLINLSVNGTSSGNIITDSGASVSALNNLPNQRITVQFDGTNFQFATNLQPIIKPQNFGVAFNSASDQSAAFNAALAFAGLNSSTGAVFTVDCGGGSVSLLTNVEATGAYVGIQHCNFVPLTGYAVTQGSGKAMVYMTGAFDQFENNYCDGMLGGPSGTNTADCLEVTGQTDRIEENTIYHYPDFGIKYNVASGTTSGGLESHNFIAEWKTTDSQFAVQADYVGKGIWNIGGDIQALYNLPHFTEYPFYLGDGNNVQGATQGTYIGNHPFNGCAGNSACETAAGIAECDFAEGKCDPVDFFIDKDSYSNNFVDNYQDDGLSYVENTENTWIGNHFILATGTTLNARFNFVATTANQMVSILNLFPPAAGATNSVPLTEWTALSGDSWSSTINTTALAAAGYNARFYLTPPDNVDVTPNAAYAESWSCSGDPCLMKLQSQSASSPVFMGENSNGAAFVETGGMWSQIINSNGNVVNTSNPVTCTGGCATNLGNGSLVNAGQMSGTILEGSTTASPLNLGLSGWGSNVPSCVAMDTDAGTALAASISSSNLNIAFSATNGHHIRYICGLD
jgi:hypothetical protein